MKVKLYFWGGLFLFLLSSCHSARQQKNFEEKDVLIDYPVGYISTYITTNLSDSVKLYLLSEEFVEHFMKIHTQYDGTHPSVATDFPDEWGVALVERLPEGRELYQVQSQNREWVFLVITSGYGTQRILDLLPVAVNLVNQQEDILETEIWTAEREVDGSFTVLKDYQWVKSVGKVTQKEYNANPQNYLRSKITTDRYFINGFSRFEKIIVDDTLNYSAVIFYYKEDKPEDWEEIVPLVQAFCEDYELLFAEVNNNFHDVQLFDYKLKFITDLDISPFTEFPAGVIFVKKGEPTKAVPFGNYERIRIELKRFFKIVEV